MPGYELALIVKSALQRPELAQAVKRTCEAIMERGGIIKQMENLGLRNLPYKMTKHGERHMAGNYFVINFDSPPKSIYDVKECLERDVDVLRQGILREEEEFVPPCLQRPCQFGELPNLEHERRAWRKKALKKLHSSRKDKKRYKLLV